MLTDSKSRRVSHRRHSAFLPENIRNPFTKIKPCDFLGQLLYHGTHSVHSVQLQIHHLCPIKLSQEILTGRLEPLISDIYASNYTSYRRQYDLSFTGTL